MSIFNVITLLGGLAMFLYGMRMMGDGLKESSSGTLKVAMEHVTNNPFKAFLLGLAVTAIIQSSTATIVITSGLVGAGIITLRQSLGIIVGANVGTTVTGQIIRLLDVDDSATSWLQFFKPSTLAPLALIIGMLLIIGGVRRGLNKRHSNQAMDHLEGANYRDYSTQPRRNRRSEVGGEYGAARQVRKKPCSNIHRGSRNLLPMPRQLLTVVFGELSVVPPAGAPRAG